jgi:hypothetical protein
VDFEDDKMKNTYQKEAHIPESTIIITPESTDI